MYADRLEHAPAPSLRERLNRDSNLLHDSVRRRPIAGKRPRQHNWENDFYEDNKPQLSRSKAPRLDARDLRLKLQNKSIPQAPQNGGMRDLREKLSGSLHTQPLRNDLPKPKPPPKANLQTSKPTRKGLLNEALLAVSRKVSASVVEKTSQQKIPASVAQKTAQQKFPASVAKKNSQQKASSSLDELLGSLGLEKYQIIFRAEEVDMTALQHMTDDDLKSMGLPMGPRKKILSALSKRS